jgi:hypothetical protein
LGEGWEEFMFQFLNPIWFFGAAALVIPVLIHLWNIRPGKVLKVGSISLINAASRKSSRSFKLLDVPLFILRCLLLLLLATLLALPVWQKKLQAAKIKGWVLFPKETFRATYKKFKPQIDSLTKAGYEFHYFNSGFAKSDLKLILLNAKDSIKAPLPDASTPPPDYWNLARELNNQVSSTLPVYIFTQNQATHFAGSKPQVALNLKWQTYTPADSVSTFIHQAWFTPLGDIRVVQGNATPIGIRYTYSNVKPDGGNAAYNITTANGRAQINLPNSKQPPVEVDATTQSMVIYTDNYTTDAGYLKAALQAVGQFGQHKFSLKIVSNAAMISANTTWLFWLSDKTISTSVVQKAQNLLVYERGKPANVSSWLSNGGPFAAALPANEKVNLFKLIASNNKYIPVWQDGFGHPVLGLQQQGKTQVYHYYSRFNPAWNDLVWSDSFPAWLLKLTTPATTNTPGQDKRVLSTQQYMPEIISEPHTAAATKPFENKSLGRYFWLALIIIFAAERWLAHRTLKTTTT